MFFRIRSLAVRFGPSRSLAISVLCHLVALLAFGLMIPLTGLSNFYLIALAACAWLLVYEQRLVTPTDQSRLGRAFFTLNGWVSVLILAGGLTDILLVA